MAGPKDGLRCEGFVEADSFARAKKELQRSTGLTDRQIDDRLEGLVWALQRDAAAVARRVRDLNLWVAVTPVGVPRLRVYIRPRPGVEDECEWMWIEEGT